MKFVHDEVHLDDIMHHLKWGQQNRRHEDSNLRDTAEEEKCVETGKDQTDCGSNRLMPAARYQSIIKQPHLQVMINILTLTSLGLGYM